MRSFSLSFLTTEAAATKMDASVLFFALFLLLAIGAIASPFNKFLRFRYFSDGYRWRGFERQDAIPLSKTLVLTGALCAGAAYEGLVSFHSARTMSSMFAVALMVGVFGTVIFSVGHSLWRARVGRRNRREKHNSQ